eukprot:4012625-Alexandrium_andersonii.AAC.1
MSASLVGSEMCIRDSPVPPRVPDTSERQRAFIRFWTPVCDSAHLFAVSYTHLTLPTICSV